MKRDTKRRNKVTKICGVVLGLSLSCGSGLAGDNRRPLPREIPPKPLRGSGGSGGLDLYEEVQHSPERERLGAQLAKSVDAGDSYISAKGKRKLYRLAGAVSIRVEDTAKKEAVLDGLTREGGALEGYEVAGERGMGIALLRAPAHQVDEHIREHDMIQTTVVSVRMTAGIRSANPVFVSPETGLLRFVTEEIIIRLHRGVEARSYFGDEWANVRRLRGTKYQFVLTLRGAPAEKVFARVNGLMADPQVEWAEPNFVGEAIKHFTPNDTLFPNQWHLNNTGQGGGTSGADVNATNAWETSTGEIDVVIAIIDDGTQLDHPDLAANIFSNANELVNALDDDNNGYTNDYNGWDFINDDNDPSPADADDNHGTATAGVAASVGNNNAGVAGPAYGCSIMPLKVIDGTNYTTVGIAQAIRYAGGVDEDGSNTWRGADVISMSLGGFEQSPAIDSAIDDTANLGRTGRGCPIFVSSGNDASGYATRRLTGIPAATWFFEWTYAKNGSVSEGEDTAWLSYVTFPDGSIERFDTTNTPAGWDLAPYSGEPWTIEDDPAREYGTGRCQARAGAIGHSEMTDIRSDWVTTTSTSNLSYKCWVSSEGGSDGLSVYLYSVAYGWLGPYLGWSGVPTVTADVGYPASHSNVIAVGAGTDFDYRSDYSQYGTGLDFVAPSSGGASGVYTTDRTGGTDGYNTNGVADDLADRDYSMKFGGTSASCPLAAGIGALVLSVNSNLTSRQVVDLMRDTCEQIGDVVYTDRWNEFYGHGRVNAQLAVTNVIDRVLRLNDRVEAAAKNIDALNSITTGAGYSVEATGDVRFRAGNTIRLKSGFTAQDGSSFRAEIGL